MVAADRAPKRLGWNSNRLAGTEKLLGNDLLSKKDVLLLTFSGRGRSSCGPGTEPEWRSFPSHTLNRWCC